MKRTTLLLAASLVGVSLAACDRSAPEGPTAAGGDAAPATSPAPAMRMQQPAQGAAEHMAAGTLNSVDQAAGTVNITHGSVASAGWPAMTMSFKLADPTAASELKPGQRVDFHFKIESGMNATVTQISPAE